MAVLDTALRYVLLEVLGDAGHLLFGRSFLGKLLKAVKGKLAQFVGRRRIGIEVHLNECLVDRILLDAGADGCSVGAAFRLTESLGIDHIEDEFGSIEIDLLGHAVLNPVVVVNLKNGTLGSLHIHLEVVDHYALGEALAGVFPLESLAALGK